MVRISGLNETEAAQECGIRMSISLKEQFESDMCRRRREEIKEYYKGLEAGCKKCKGSKPDLAYKRG
jgi:hypothetical protein